MRNKLSSLVITGQSGSTLYANEADRLIYLDLPLQVGYQLGARHSLAFGMAFSPLVGYQKTDIVQKEDNLSRITEERTRNDGLQRNGFANFDVAPLLTYRLQVTRQLDVMAEMRYGLFDVTDNAYFNTDLVDDRNHQLRLGLSYSLTRR
jgi:hypothetical protein